MFRARTVTLPGELRQMQFFAVLAAVVMGYSRTIGFGLAGYELLLYFHGKPVWLYGGIVALIGMAVFFLKQKKKTKKKPKKKLENGA